MMQGGQARGGRSNMTISMPALNNLPSPSTVSNPSIPIRLALDLSDEKSQNLFIFEQKYNMKKNDCFNLEKQRNTLQI